MIDRRDLLKACVAGGALPVIGCSGEKSANQSPASPAPMPAGMAKKMDGTIEVIFKGMTFFLIPNDRNQKLVHVLLPRNEHNSKRKPHLGTLAIPRTAISDHSDATPVASDESNVYFSLHDKVLRIIPRQFADPVQWSMEATPNLLVGRDEVPETEPRSCGEGNWGSIMWLIDFKNDLCPDAVIDPNWRRSRALFGRVELTHGELENGFGPDGLTHYTYELKNTKSVTKRRLTKDSVRYRLTSPFVQFALGDKSCIVDTGLRSHSNPTARLMIGIDHVPGYWTDPKGPLQDFESLYELMNPTTVGERANWPVPRDRRRCDEMSAEATSGCECCPTSRMFV